MNFAFTVTLLLSLLIAAVYCNHDHNSHHGDDKWITFVSQIESFWKTDTPVKLTETHTESSLNNKDVYSSEKTWEMESHKHTPEISLEKATTYDDIENGAKLGLAAIISIPVVGLIVLICCCYCICKCCCGMCAPNESNVVVMNSNMVQPAPAPQPTQIIVQQPVYSHMPPPQQQVHHFPPPHQQWAPPQFQQPMPPPQYYPGDGIDNPNFQFASAPPQMTPEKY